MARNIDSTFAASSIAKIELTPGGAKGVLVGAPLFPHNSMSGQVFGYGLNKNGFDKSNKFGTKFGFDFALDPSAFDDYEPERSEPETQFGARFGAAIAAGDFNGDQFADIAIGAPTWSRNKNGFIPETGRVYIYEQSVHSARTFTADLASKFEPKLILRTNGFDDSSDMRFGSALASNGDLNDDQYDDLVVAAPGANGGKGVVYIYNGGRDGLHEIPSQVIQEENVQRFGFSIAFRSDVDGNEYNDLVVSAPESNDVYIYKTRASIQVKFTLEVPSGALREEQKCSDDDNKLCLDIKACGKYSGKGLPAQLSGTATVKLDSQVSQKRLKSNGQTSLELRWDNMQNGQEKCQSLPVRIQWDTKNKIAPVVIEGELKMDETDNSPITNPFIDNSDKKLMYFWKDCGEDNKCDTVFAATGQVVTQSNNNFIGITKLVADEGIDLINRVELKISGEKSYGSQLTIATSERKEAKSIKLKRSGSEKSELLTCEWQTDSQVDLCYFNEPKGYTESDTYQIDMHYSIKPNGLDKSFTIDAHFNNTNEDPAEEVVSQSIDIIVESNILPYAKTKLQGESQETSTLTFYNDTENDAAALTIQQEFTVKNQGKFTLSYLVYLLLGPANIQKADFTVKVPLFAPNGHTIIIHDLEKFAPKLKHDSLRSSSCELSNKKEINDRIRALTTYGMDDEITNEMKQNKFTCTGQNSICAVYTCSALKFQVFLLFCFLPCLVNLFPFRKTISL